VKSLVSIVVAAVVMAFTGAAFAAEQAPQPLTRAACEQAGMKWSDRANVCTDRKHHDKKQSEAKNKKGERKDLMQRPPQPLTRAACQEAGLWWNDRANVCGVNQHHEMKKIKKMKKKQKKAKKKARKNATQH
jgi:hypothetical protein